VTLSIPGVDLLPCAVVIECYAGPPCTARVSDRVRVLALKQPVNLTLPGRAERVTKGHKGPTGAQLELASSLSESGVGIWSEMDKLVTADPSLSVLRDGCAEAMVMAKAANTTATYKGAVGRWQLFAAGRGCSVPFPVNEALFLLFLTEELSRARDKGLKAGVVLNCVYGVNLVCAMLSVPGPGTLASVSLMTSSARLQLARPTVRKKAASKLVIAKLCDHLLPGCDPSKWDWINLRTALFASLGFVLTGRWSELNELIPADLTDHGEHFAAFIEVRKCDQFREGSVVPFVNTGEIKGVCNLLRVFMGLMPEGSELQPLFRRIDRGKVRGQFFRSEGIGYSRMSECVKDALVAIGEDPKRYGLHSFRSGGATEVASRPGFDPRGLEKHGGWAPNSGSMPGYIEDSAVIAMIVPNLLAL
jgi:hypothetical protein